MKNKIQLAVFDWAGTTVDFGSQAPAQIFDRTFTEFGLKFSSYEINAPMGMEKKAHIRTMLSTEHGKELWLSAQGRTWEESDVEKIYQRFEDNLRSVVADYSHVIPGVVETVAQLRKTGMHIGSTTGYTSEIMSKVIPVAAAEGYSPDSVVTPDITGHGRPTPFMLYECMRRANVYPPSHVVKAGDTVTDIQEGKNAGAWAVGILTGSNLMGFSRSEFANASEAEIQERKDQATRAYRNAGADLVIDSIRDLPEAIEVLNSRLEEEEMK